MNNKLMFSSESVEWSTPQKIFDDLNFIHNFTLDACATAENAKCKHYFTKENDALIQDWGGHVVFMNPPYGRGITDKWIKKAFDESLKGAKVVCLIPSRTDTIFWHEYCMKGKIEFIKGRLKFGGHKDAAPFPSAIVIFE